MGYSYVYPPLSKGKPPKQTPAQFRSDELSLPLASHRQEIQGEVLSREPIQQTRRVDSSPNKQIFPDLGPPDLGSFTNFMSQMNSKFPFQIARKRDGLVARWSKDVTGPSRGCEQNLKMSYCCSLIKL